MRGSVVLAAAGLCLAACANQSARELKSEGGGKPYGYLVGSVDRWLGWRLVSGSSWPGIEPLDVSQQVVVASAHDAAAKITLTAPRQAMRASSFGQAPQLTQYWLSDFAAALGRATEDVFGRGSPSVDLLIHEAPDGAAIDILEKSDPDSGTLSLQFYVPHKKMLEQYRRLVTTTLGHETHHAFLLHRNGGKLDKGQSSRVLVESAADLFGSCVSLRTLGYSRWLTVVGARKIPAGPVFTDSQVKEIIDGENDKPNGPVNAMSWKLTTTIWSSVLGPDRIVEKGTAQGVALENLCRPETIGSIEAFRSFLRRLATDNTDALELPESDAKDEGERALALVDRWRERHGLPKRFATGTQSDDETPSTESAER